MSIRFRLTITAIAVILVANSLLSYIALQYLGNVWMGEVQTRVRRNLNSASAAFQNYVTRKDGKRAVGTRLNEVVSEAVLDHGKIWSKPAFVVNDWYITARRSKT